MQTTTSPSDLATRASADQAPIVREDRRVHPRFLLTLAITMHGENNFYSGLSENFSEAGVFIATHHALPIGTPVVLSFTLPDSSEPLAVVGTVQWIRGPHATARTESIFGQGAEADFVKPGMGVQFSAAAEESIRAIRAFMRRRSPEFFA